jgi:predicted nucleotidyltransferase
LIGLWLAGVIELSGMNGEPKEELQRVIGKFHGVALEQVLAEIDYLRDSGDSVIAGGSLAYGLGNPLSDLDLLVTGPAAEDSPPIPLQHFINSLRVDVWKLGSGFISDAFDRAEQALAGEAALLGAFGDVDHEDELKLLHRVAFGVLIDGGKLKPRKGRDYRAVASDLVVREYAERMRASALSAQLSLRAGRPIAAVVNARLAVEAALNAAVSYRGMPFSGDKWLCDRLDGQASDLAQIYEPFRQLPEGPGREASRFVDAALSACLEMWGFDLAIDMLAPTARWRTKLALQVVEIGADRLLLSTDLGALWSLDEEEVEAWGQLAPDGTVEPDTTWSLGECDTESSHLCLRIHEIGLLSLHWSKGVAIEELTAAQGLLGAKT